MKENNEVLAEHGETSTFTLIMEVEIGTNFCRTLWKNLFDGIYMHNS